MEISAFDIIKDLEPFEEALLHIRRAKGQPVADIIEEKTSAFGEEPAHQKSFERNVVGG